MQNIKAAIGLLEAVHSTMESISIVGIDNQDKFVGCANAIQTATKTLRDHLQKTLNSVQDPKEATDG